MVDWNDDTPMRHLKDLTPSEAGEVFATEYDETIRSLMDTLMMLGFTIEERDAILSMNTALLEAYVEFRPQTVAEAMPLTRMSDLLYAGALAHELWKRREVARSLFEDM